MNKSAVELAKRCGLNAWELTMLPAQTTRSLLGVLNSGHHEQVVNALNHKIWRRVQVRREPIPYIDVAEGFNREMFLVGP